MNRCRDLFAIFVIGKMQMRCYVMHTEILQ